MGVRIVALTYLPSFGTRAPLLSEWEMGGGIGTEWPTYLDHLSMDMTLSPNLEFFRLGIY